MALARSIFRQGADFTAAEFVGAPINAQVVEASVQLNYTTILDVVFVVLSIVLIWRFLHTGGRDMLQMMDAPAGAGSSGLTTIRSK